ncbi:MAG: penicillin-binding protein 1C, partial [Candidatus Electrothrix sp. AR3]|nr:penicillin-binding protein 1C [Candidatus Electrothrix sp. AR3]
IYGLAFEQGILHPESKILDRPQRFGSYGPGNFDGRYQGWVSVREALHRSLNLPAVEVLERVGPQRLLSRFARLGITVDQERTPGLSLALGGTAASLEELTALYAALADKGWYRTLSYLSDVSSPVGKRMLSPAATWYVDDILRTRPLPVGRASNNFQNKRIRYKTGTSYGFRDAWAIGYSQQHTVGIWIGRPDWGYGQQITGANSAVPVLFQAFATLSAIQEELADRRTENARIPVDVLLARHDQLPFHLQWFRRSRDFSESTMRPSIYFPVDGSIMYLGQDRDTNKKPVLTLKAHGGIPPFHWLVNGQPLGSKHQEATTSYTPKGPGLMQITLVDSRGKRDKVSVWIEMEASTLSPATL